MHERTVNLLAVLFALLIAPPQVVSILGGSARDLWVHPRQEPFDPARHYVGADGELYFVAENDLEGVSVRATRRRRIWMDVGRELERVASATEGTLTAVFLFDANRDGKVDTVLEGAVENGRAIFESGELVEIDLERSAWQIGIRYTAGDSGDPTLDGRYLASFRSSHADVAYLTDELPGIVGVRFAQHDDFDRIELELEDEASATRSFEDSVLEMKLAARPAFQRQGFDPGMRFVGEGELLAADSGAELRFEARTDRVRSYRLDEPHRLVLDFVDPELDVVSLSTGSEEDLLVADAAPEEQSGSLLRGPDACGGRRRLDRRGRTRPTALALRARGSLRRRRDRGPEPRGRVGRHAAGRVPRGLPRRRPGRARLLQHAEHAAA
jgi:hypothetical protein